MVDSHILAQQAWCLPKGQVYLLNHAIGLLPSNSRAALDDAFFTPWLDPANAWPKWLAALEDFKTSLAKLLGGEPGHFCPQTNISSAFTKLLQSYTLPASRQTLLLSEDDFPTIGFVASCCPNLKVKYMPSGAPLEDVNLWAEHLTSDVGVVMVTHAQSSTGRLVPVKEISKLAAEREVFCVVDIAQSAGIVPIDLADWHADAVIGSCVKWLCGGPGAGFLWISSDASRLRPVDVGWFSHRDPFEFDIHSFEYASDATRFLGGTPSVAPFVLANNSILQLLNIGIDTIREHNSQARDLLSRWFAQEDLVSPAQPAFQNGSLIVKASDANKKMLQLKNLAFDERPNGLRLSPHIYTPLDSLGKA